MKLKFKKETTVSAIKKEGATTRVKKEATVGNSFDFQQSFESKGVALTGACIWLERRVPKAEVNRLAELFKALKPSINRHLRNGQEGIAVLSAEKGCMVRRVVKLKNEDGLYALPDGKLFSEALLSKVKLVFYPGVTFLKALRSSGRGVKVVLKQSKTEVTGVAFGKVGDFNSLVTYDRAKKKWDVVDFELVTNRFNKRTRASLVADNLPAAKLLPASL